jgi:hypothetical protein
MSDSDLKHNPEWREFENLAADIQRQLAPDARVETNVKMQGRRSGIERQIDIFVQQTVGQYEIRIIIDCKDYKKPVDVKDIEAFMGMVEDVGANKGAMIAASGFSSTAKQRAKDSGIDLYQLVDTRETKWKTYVSIPCVVRDAYIDSFSFRFSGTGQFRMAMTDFRYMPLYRADGTLINYLQNLMLERWETDGIPTKPGEYKNILLTSEETFIKTDAQLYALKVEVHVKVAERLRFGQLPIQDTRGFKDEIGGGYATKGFTTAIIAFNKIDETWEEISSIEQLSIKPVITLSVKSMPQKFVGTSFTPNPN